MSHHDIVIEKYGSAATLKQRELAPRAPGDDEVAIDVAYSGINFADIQMRLGFYPDARPNAAERRDRAIAAGDRRGQRREPLDGAGRLVDQARRGSVGDFRHDGGGSKRCTSGPGPGALERARRMHRRPAWCAAMGFGTCSGRRSRSSR
jgi:hypothetical protein